MSYRIGVDVGGTFTDLLLLDEQSGETLLLKVPSSPEDPSRAVIAGAQQILERAGVAPDRVGTVMHGTTVGTNAVLTGRTARVGLLCTEGFEHVLHIARGETPGPLSGWVTMIKPEPLAAIEDTRGISQRTSAQGETVRTLDEDQVAAAIDELVRSGVEAVAISFINSFADPEVERRVRAIVGERHPGLSVSISTDILPEFREYERTNVVVMNAALRPRMAQYLRGLSDDLRGLGCDAPLSILRSDGGLMTVDYAIERPVHTLFSGPAGGVAGAAGIARAAGFPNFLSFDMGGTSTDVALCLDGEPVITRETNIGQLPVKVPTVDVRSVGAGGGSIAHVPEVTRALRVGPESAGAVPGPAAYGRGGTGATVTDANLVLGYLPGEIAGGGMALDVEASRNAVAKIAEALDISVEAAAEGIVDVVNENMTGALRLVSVEKGHDPRDFALVAFGGAGPLHANALAELMGSFPVLVPKTPGVLAAYGDVISPSRSEFAETFIERFDRIDGETVAARLTELRAQAQAWLEGEGVPEDAREYELSVDVRYHKQALEIPIETTLEEMREQGFDGVVERFTERHEREYGFTLETVCEFVNLRATAIGRSSVPAAVPESAPEGSVEDAVIGEHRIFHRGEWHAAAMIDRDHLGPGHRVSGPAVIVQADSTTLVLPGYAADVDALGNLLIAPVAEVQTADSAESPIVIDIIENALKNIRREMDTVIFRAAMSTVIREEHDSFPLVTDDKGNMLAGQFGWPLEEFFATQYPKDDLEPGDVLMVNDPYLCGGAIQHTPDMLLLRPIFFRERLVGFASQLGNLTDIGGRVPGSMPADGKTIFDEGIRFPPVKLYRRGELNREILSILARNSRTPELTVADTLALAAGTRAAEQRVIELCERFGADTYLRTCQALLDRTYRAAKLMLREFIPEEPLEFEDWVDDDGRGNGPFKIKMRLWREGEKAILDFDGTAGQAPGPINLYMGESMFKMVTGIVLIMALDPQILFNHGYNSLFEVRFPKGSVIQPRFPAPLANRAHTLARIMDVLQGVLAQQNPQMACGAACGSSPHFLYSGTDADGEFFFFYEINYGGIPGRPVGDGMDVHAWWPHVISIPAEYAESYFPLRIDTLKARTDSGGAGLHRGGNGVEKVYAFLAPGEVSIHDDRAVSRPWGIGGGLAAANSRKVLVRADGSEEVLPSKFDSLHVEPGDKLIYITAGGGGWGDPLARDPARVLEDVRRGLLSVEKAREEYGVALDPETLALEQAETERLREQVRAGRPDPLPVFDFGKPAEAVA